MSKLFGLKLQGFTCRFRLSDIIFIEIEVPNLLAFALKQGVIMSHKNKNGVSSDVSQGSGFRHKKRLPLPLGKFQHQPPYGGILDGRA